MNIDQLEVTLVLVKQYAESGQQRLLPCLQKLFNSCLTSGNYPTIWTEGYVVPIYKANNTADPNNYRGITVTAAKGKLFNSDLSK
jgi:hypothetical protein